MYFEAARFVALRAAGVLVDSHSVDAPFPAVPVVVVPVDSHFVHERVQGEQAAVELAVLLVVHEHDHYGQVAVSGLA